MNDEPTDRFNEEKSAYTVRGSDQPDLDTGVAAIRATVRQLPVRPGVYRMLDTKGDDIDYYYETRFPGEPADGVADINSRIVEPRQLRVGIRKTFG